MGKEYERETIIEAFPGKNLPLSELIQISVIDNKVFCGPPWNEGTFCECGAMQIQSARSEICELCGVSQISLQKRGSLIKSELINPNSYTVVLKDKERVVGYGWGYQYESIGEFTETKYKDTETRKVVENALSLAGIQGKFYYFSGTGIDSPYQRRGLSHLVAKEITQYAENHGLTAVVRTHAESPIVHVMQKLGFNIIVGPEIPDFKDIENPVRVLLVKNGTIK